jgi:hypothetical protein
VTDTAQTIGPWIQTAAIVASFIGVIVVVTYNQKIARRKASLDFLMLQQSNERILKDRTLYIELREAKNLVQYTAPDKRQSPEFLAILSVLNRHELAAVGIEEKTMEEEVYKRWARAQIVFDWISCRSFVVELRSSTDHPKLFCELEALAKRWANDDERPKI